jgi:hypothetical protein
MERINKSGMVASFDYWAGQLDRESDKTFDKLKGRYWFEEKTQR